jgi:hypothetical protein
MAAESAQAQAKAKAVTKSLAHPMVAAKALLKTLRIMIVC